MWYRKHRSPRQLEERRLLAARWLGAGRLSQAEIARALAVSRAAVSPWARRLADAPAWRRAEGLRRRGHTGRPPRLSEAEWTAILRVRARGARASGFDTERWTLRRIARGLRRDFGVTYHPHALSALLRAHGWSPQRPVVRERERDEALMTAWLRHDWPAVKRGLGAAGSSLPSWTKRVTRFGPACARRGRRAARHLCSSGSAARARSPASCC